MKWLYLHFPQLQLDSLLNSDAAHTAEIPPCAIIDTRVNRICQINDPAQEQHIESGMGLATAASLCHQLQLFDYQPELEQQRLQELAQWLYLICADIILYPPNGLLLEVSSMLELYQGLENYWQRIRSLLQQQRLNFIACCGRSPLEARTLARAGIHMITLDKSAINQQLQSLPIEELELDESHLEALQRIGIQQFRQLLELPRNDLQQATAPELIRLLQRLQGQYPEHLDSFRPALHFSQTRVLHYETDNREALRFPLRTLLQDMERFLRQADRQTQSIEICLQDREQQQHLLSVYSAQAETRADIWLQLSCLKLEQLNLTRPIVSLKLHSGALLEPHDLTRDLFSSKPGTLQPAQLVSLLQARLGEDRVHGLQLYQDYRPECASDYAPCFTRSQIDHNELPLLRPILLLPQPRPLNQPVSLCSEPERIQSSWWLNSPVCRDYFIAETRRQQCLWVFRDQYDQWFVQGCFG